MQSLVIPLSSQVVLRELIMKMGGVEVKEDLTTLEMEGYMGGQQLRAVANRVPGGKVTVTAKSNKRLRDALLHKGIGAPILVLVAKQVSTRVPLCIGACI